MHKFFAPAANIRQRIGLTVRQIYKSLILLCFGFLPMLAAKRQNPLETPT
jgi:hypothetical protein